MYYVMLYINVLLRLITKSYRALTFIKCVVHALKFFSNTWFISVLRLHDKRLDDMLNKRM